jgi:hypothetical protein
VGPSFSDIPVLGSDDTTMPDTDLVFQFIF